MWNVSSSALAGLDAPKVINKRTENSPTPPIFLMAFLLHSIGFATEFWDDN
jgi:hypothetical protein